jgi:CDP-diacylglycerol--serine O-phosphatidyltransferase
MVGVAPHFESSPLWAVAMVVGVLVSSYLLVSEIPMFALKFKQWGWKGNEVKYCFAGFAIAVLAVSVAAEGARGFLEGWWPIILMYVLLSWIMFLKKK